MRVHVALHIPIVKFMPQMLDLRSDCFRDYLGCEEREGDEDERSRAWNARITFAIVAVLTHAAKAHSMKMN